MQLDVLKSATNGFADGNKIGAGGFGEVYKGELVSSDHTVTVAVKRLNRIHGQGDSEFFKEVIMLSSYKHENIISLLGYCDEEDEKILVYEYASKKSLDKHLGNNELTWIADFGLAKIGPANQQNSIIITNNNNVAGTIGYVDPQYMETGMLTKESDVYSFGVVLFEVLCGRLCISDMVGRSKYLTTWVRYHHKQNRLDEIVWSNTKDEIHPSSLRSFSTIAYQCLEREYDKRPSMKKIVQELETSLEFQGVPTVAGGGGGGILDFMRNNPKVISGNAGHLPIETLLLQSMLKDVVNKNPDVRRLIEENQDDFLCFINEPVDVGEYVLFTLLFF
ncbi:hypothetical protein LXL04_009140 [Taraxacum kok-saghyz]